MDKQREEASSQSPRAAAAAAAAAAATREHSPDSTCSRPTTPPGRPRPPPRRLTPEEAATIRVRNRRRQYLDKHPEYLSSAEHEFANPELYDALIRRFQPPSQQRDRDRERGWGKMLEAALLRGEARLLAEQSRRLGPDDDDDDDDAVETREEGRERWEAFVRERFVRGGDEDFDYARVVDGDEGLDEMERRDREEEWFDGEEPAWADDGGGGDGGGEGGRVLRGQTGVQDY